MDHIIDYINTLYKQLRSGDISIRPTITDNGSDPSIYPCTFCDYKSVCLYDVFVNKNKEISSQLEKEVLKGEDNA
jgi:ATP-dependent helicase/DNAse subunit B